MLDGGSCGSLREDRNRRTENELATENSSNSDINGRSRRKRNKKAKVKKN
jgi:hypothetical protein